MNKFRVFATLIVVAFFTSCDRDDLTTEEGVEINGVRWATRNVDASGTFTRSPEHMGRHFTWQEAQNACPRGWRLPTGAELNALSLVRNIWIESEREGNAGRLFGVAPYQIFLPAAGFRIGSEVRDISTGGGYWSTQSIDEYDAWSMEFSRAFGSSMSRSWSRASGLSVRCVAE